MTSKSVSRFFTPFSSSGIPHLPQYPFFFHKHKSFQLLETQNQLANVANNLSIPALVASNFFSWFYSFFILHLIRKPKCQWNSMFLSKEVFLSLNDCYFLVAGNKFLGHINLTKNTTTPIMWPLLQHKNICTRCQKKIF